MATSGKLHGANNEEGTDDDWFQESDSVHGDLQDVQVNHGTGSWVSTSPQTHKWSTTPYTADWMLGRTKKQAQFGKMCLMHLYAEAWFVDCGLLWVATRRDLASRCIILGGTFSLRLQDWWIRFPLHVPYLRVWWAILLADSIYFCNLTEPWHSTRNIWGFHGGDYKEWHLLGYYATWFL
jgi:hypothetical protein